MTSRKVKEPLPGQAYPIQKSNLTVRVTKSTIVFIQWKNTGDMMEKHIEILNERFGKDSLLALATVDKKGIPWVRTIDAIFFKDSFYTITYALSNKVKHIENNAAVALSGEWFSGHALAISLGYIKLEENRDIADKLRAAFASWYDNGHTNEDDPNTIILKMELTDGILFDNGIKYEF